MKRKSQKTQNLVLSQPLPILLVTFLSKAQHQAQNTTIPSRMLMWQPISIIPTGKYC